MKKLCVFLTVIMVFAVCGCAFAGDERYVREEASRRGMNLISVEKAKEIAAERIGERLVRFKEVELDNEADDYPNDIHFRPVYQIECVSGNQEYDIDVDAVTGKILKFKLDD